MSVQSPGEIHKKSAQSKNPEKVQKSNKLSLVGMQLHEKICEENFDFSSEGPSSGVTWPV
jgi:hypothetical protein